MYWCKSQFMEWGKSQEENQSDYIILLSLRVRQRWWWWWWWADCEEAPWDWSPPACCSAWCWREAPRSPGARGRRRSQVPSLLLRGQMVVSFQMTWGAHGFSGDPEKTLSSGRSSLDSAPGATDYRTIKGEMSSLIMICLLHVLYWSSMSSTITNMSVFLVI